MGPFCKANFQWDSEPTSRNIWWDWYFLVFFVLSNNMLLDKPNLIVLICRYESRIYDGWRSQQWDTLWSWTTTAKSYPHEIEHTSPFSKRPVGSAVHLRGKSDSWGSEDKHENRHNEQDEWKGMKLMSRFVQKHQKWKLWVSLLCVLVAWLCCPSLSKILFVTLTRKYKTWFHVV